MEFLERLVGWLGLRPQPFASAITIDLDDMRRVLDTGRSAKRAEDYPTALEKLQRALTIAEGRNDRMAMAVVNLQIADVLALMKRWDEAHELLSSVRREARAFNEKTQMAYALMGIGRLEQAQANWVTAQRYYEEALSMAREAGSVPAEGRVLGYLAATYLNDNNATYAVHLLRESIMRLNVSEDIEPSSYFVGLMALALIATGQEPEGDQLLSRALRLAERMKYHVYIRRWSLELARRRFAVGRYQQAYEFYKRALEHFKPEHLGEDYIEALCRLSIICIQLGLDAEGLALAQRATERSATAAIADDSHLAALVQGALGMALLADGQPAEAREQLENAALAYENLMGLLEDKFEIEVLRRLASAYDELGDYAKVSATYQRGVQRAAVRDLPLEQALVHRAAGFFHRKYGRQEAAIEAWMSALAIYERKKEYEYIARICCDLATARRFIGQGQRAMKDYEQALMALNAMQYVDPVVRGLVLANAATAYVDQGDIDSAKAFFRESLQLAEQTGDVNAEATRRGNYGWFLLAIGHVRDATDSLKRALELSKAAGLRLQTAVQTDNLGLAYAEAGDRNRALEYHREALALVTDAHWTSVFQINQAMTLLALERAAEARDLLHTALADGRARRDVEVIIRALTGLARVALTEGPAESAGELLGEAVTLARKADSRRLLAKALSVQSQQQAALQHSKESRALWEEALKLFRIIHSPQAKSRPSWLEGLAD